MKFEVEVVILAVLVVVVVKLRASLAESNTYLE